MIQTVQLGSKSERPPVLRVAHDSDYALTARQSLFWLDENLFPGVPYHHVVLTLRLTGKLDVERFSRAYRDTLAAFDQFRLVFFERQGEPRQAFRGDFEPSLPVVDLRDTGESLETWIEERCVRPFDFSSALFEGVLLRLAAEEHVLYFNQHHIISDGTSVGYFATDLAKRYAGEPVIERPSFAHYIQAEQAYRKSPRNERDGKHFGQKLAFGGGRGPNPAGGGGLKLYGRSADVRSVGTDRSVLDGGPERWARLTELVRDARIELADDSMSRLVAFATVLFAFVYRVSENRSLVIGTPIPNRTAEFLDTGGLVMEQTFLSVEIEEGETFASLAAKVRRELFSGLRHGRHCVSDRGLSYVTLNLLRLPKLTMPGLYTELALVPAPATGARFSGLSGDTRDRFGVHVLGFEGNERLKIGFDFHRDSFESGLRERARGHFLALFDAMLGDLDTPLDAVSLVSEAERAALLEAGRGPAPEPHAEDVVARIVEVCARRAAEPAILSGGETITYAELAQRAGQLARRLVELGVVRESRVGVCVARGADEPLGMLATMWAGGAYVPLDPSHPADRIRMILEDAAPEVLITHRALVATLDLPPGVRVLCIDEEREALSSYEPLAPAAADAGQLAYVLFTSGSTGRPKGVELPRGALSNFLRSMAREPGMSESDRLLAVTTITFDIAGLELFLPLWVGASLQIADRETTLDASKLREVLEREPITILQATPTTFRLLLEAGYRGELRPLRKLCGGEAMSAELASGLVATSGELWNMYGPTETTVWSTLSRVTPEMTKRIHIGRAIDHTQVYVLDARGELLPEGVVGELCIGGAGVARGYLARPELTAEKFIQNPHGPAGEVIYRTGDLARFLPGGELECLGRVDHQVKVRGFRIELGEIESCLRAVVGVRDAVVVARPRPGKDPQLVAYFVGEADVDALRAAARARLPGYMHPALYAQLDSFPLNTNGKVDRKRLPAPTVQELRESRAPGAALEGDAQVRIAAMFREVLGLSSVDADTDFFALGGDSVRVIELRRRIQAAFGVELPLGAMFDSPSVRRLAGALGPRDETGQPLCVVLRRGRSDLPPLVCVLGVALYYPLAQALAGDRTVYGVHVRYDRKQSRGMTPSVEHVASLYVDAIRKHIPHGPYHLAGLCFGGVVAYEVARQLLALREDVRSVALFDAWLPRGVWRDPRARLRALLSSARRDPREALAQARGVAERLTHEVRQRLGPRWVVQEETPHERQLGTEEGDLLVTGRLAASMMSVYNQRVRPIARPVQLFRAMERTEPDWWTLDWDLGWGQVVDEVSVHPVEGSHLGILKTGHVQAIARELDRAMTESEELPVEPRKLISA